MIPDRLKFAIKSSLSLVLAVIITFWMGWTQVNTAIITIIIIASIGSVGDSVTKGLLRVIGTIVGAIVGMSLIAIFPQERELYLLSLSLFVTLILYLARAYRGDNSIFMLTAVIMMMVFQNGAVENSFIYGIDRTFMTVFGIVVYTLVGIFLWPYRRRVDIIDTLVDLDHDYEESMAGESTRKTELNSMLEDTQGSRFVWWDSDDLKGAFVSFLIFWISTLLWIWFNPPGGFMLVALATAMSVITTFTPIKPSLLMIVFSASFLFASLMYVFVLPYLHHGWELGIFIFTYGMLGFYLVPPKISMFFLLGVMTLGLNNEMHYNFDMFLLTLFVFYAFLTILLVAYYIPFSTRAEDMFIVSKKRFFVYVHTLNNSQNHKSWYSKILRGHRIKHLVLTLEKMQLWGGQIDGKYFDNIDSDAILSFTRECEELAYVIVLENNKEIETSLSICCDAMSKIDFERLKIGRF